MRVFLVCLTVAAGSLAGQTQSADRVVPATVPEPTYTTQTAHDRLTTYLKDLVNPISLLRSGASAGWGQWRNRPDKWGEGGEGYGRRFASAYGEHIVAATLMYGGGSLLHEDNRYISSGLTDNKARVRYALESSFKCRHDDGTRHVSISKVAALAGAALISRTWQPHDSRGMGSAAANFGITVGVSAGFDLVREFIPALAFQK